MKWSERINSAYVPDAYLNDYLNIQLTWVDGHRKKEALRTLKSIRQRALRNEAERLKKEIVQSVGFCEVCGCSFIPVLQIHHVLPISKFGNNDNNILCVCPTCHKTIHYFYGLFDSKKDIHLEHYSKNFEMKTLKNTLDICTSYAKKWCGVYEYIKSFRPSNASQE